MSETMHTATFSIRTFCAKNAIRWTHQPTQLIPAVSQRFLFLFCHRRCSPLSSLHTSHASGTWSVSLCIGHGNDGAAATSSKITGERVQVLGGWGFQAPAVEPKTHRTHWTVWEVPGVEVLGFKHEFSASPTALSQGSSKNEWLWWLSEINKDESKGLTNYYIMSIRFDIQSAVRTWRQQNLKGKLPAQPPGLWYVSSWPSCACGNGTQQMARHNLRTCTSKCSSQTRSIYDPLGFTMQIQHDRILSQKPASNTSSSLASSFCLMAPRQNQWDPGGFKRQ